MTPLPFLQPIYDVETPHMAAGRVAILGDAAFIGRPHVAAGVTKAAEDAMALATALKRSDDVSEALRSFEQLRMPVNRRIVDRGRTWASIYSRSSTRKKTVEKRRSTTPPHP